MRSAGLVELLLALASGRLGRRQRRGRLLPLIAGPGQFLLCRGSGRGEIAELAEVAFGPFEQAEPDGGVDGGPGLAVGLLRDVETLAGALHGRRGSLLALVEPVHAVGDGDGGQGGVRRAQVAYRLPGVFGGPGGLIAFGAQSLQVGFDPSDRVVGLAGRVGQPFGISL
jgi:hypothetical protein